MSNERKRKIPAPGERLEQRKGRPWHGNNIVLTLHFCEVLLSPQMVQYGPCSFIRISQRYKLYSQCYCNQEMRGRKSQNCLSNGYENSNPSLSHAKSYPSATKPGWPAYLAIEKICQHAGNLEPQDIILNLHHWPSAKPLCCLLLNSGDKEVPFVSLTDHL